MLVGRQRHTVQTQIADARSGPCQRIDGVAQAAHPHHVAALLIVGIGIEQVVGHIFEDGLDHLAAELVQRHGGVGNGGLIHQMLHADRRPGQQTGAPAKAGREGDLGILDLHQRIEDELIEAAIEIATPIQQAIALRQGLIQAFAIGRTHALDQRAHGSIGRQQAREHRQQTVAPVAQPAAAHIGIEHRQELAIRTGIGDQGLAAGVGDHHRRRHAVMGMAAQDHIQPAQLRSQLEIDIHAVVRQQHHQLRPLGARLVDMRLQLLLLDAKTPVRHHPARIGNRRVGKGLTDHRHRHPAQRTHGPGLEHRITEVLGLDVLCQKLDAACAALASTTQLLHQLLHPLLAVGEFPVPGHDVHAQQLTGLGHVGTSRPQRGGRALPGVAAVEQQTGRPAGAQLFHQCGQVGKATHLAVALGGTLEIEIAEGMRLGRAGTNTELLEQRLAHQMRRAVETTGHTQIDTGLAEIHRQQLRMTVGEMQQRNIAKTGQVVEARIGGMGGRTRGRCSGCRRPVQRQPGGRGHGQQTQEFATTQGRHTSASFPPATTAGTRWRSTLTDSPARPGQAARPPDA